MPESQETFRNNISNEIKLVLEMTARVDERVKLVVEKQSEMTVRLNSFIDAHNVLASRVTVLEASQNSDSLSDLKQRYDYLFEKITRLEAATTSEELKEMEESVNSINDTLEQMQIDQTKSEKRLEKMEESSSSAWGKAKFFFDLAVKAAWAVAVGWLLYRLGLSSPHSPGI